VHLPQQEEKKRFQKRLFWSSRFIMGMFALLMCRFIYLQIIQHYYYAQEASRNQITLMPLQPSRGRIIDRNNVVLAQNLPSHILEIIPSKAGDLKKTLAALQKIVAITPKDLKRFERFRRESKVFEPILLKSQLTEEESARVAANSWRFPEVVVRVSLVRDYTYGYLTSHVIGYVGRISAKDNVQLSRAGKSDEYLGATYIGRTGLEAFYEDILRGKTGFEAIETNAMGHRLRALERQEPVNGKTLKLSLDIRLQEMADKLFGTRRGALVAMNPQTGEILAFVSKPSFDANLFVNGIDYETWHHLNTDWKRPLLNRASYGLYPPGSTLKPFIAMAALHLGLLGHDDVRASPGAFRLPNSWHQFRDSKPTGHGMINLQRAITVSSDTFFYRLAWEMGIDALHPLLSQFGFGKKTGIDLPEEAKGILPSRQWKAERFAKYHPRLKKWLPGDTISIGIGQGYNTYTPLQMAQATAILANSGKFFQPYLVKKIISTNQQYFSQQAKLLRRLPFRLADFNYVKQGMENVLQKDGTAWRVGKGLLYRMGGKTGTAQVVKIAQGKHYNQFALAEKYRDHSWFIAFAPAEQPKVAIAVIVENSGWGAAVAAPIARALSDFHLYGIVPPALKDQLITLKKQNVDMRFKKQTQSSGTSYRRRP
jgi:penicillin-binding protein 2